MCLSVILSGLLFPIGQDSEKCSHDFCLTIYEVSKMNKACWVRFSSKAVDAEILHIGRDTVFQLKTKN